MELARASGQRAAGLLTDLAKAYEHVDHGKLAPFAAATVSPREIFGLCLSLSLSMLARGGWSTMGCALNGSRWVARPL